MVSTLYPDRPQGARSSATSASATTAKRCAPTGVEVDERRLRPVRRRPAARGPGDDREHSRGQAKKVSWFEYWDVNPYNQATTHAVRPRGSRPGRRAANALASPQAPRRPGRRAAAQHLRRGAERPRRRSRDVRGTRSSAPGTRAAPAAVTADRSAARRAAAAEAAPRDRCSPSARRSAAAGAVGDAALRLRHGTADQIAGRVARSTGARRTRSRPASARGPHWVPKADFGAGRAWVARELQWDAYLLRARLGLRGGVRRTTRSPRAATTSTARAPTSARAAGSTTCCRWSTPSPRSRARSCATRSWSSRRRRAVPYGLLGCAGPTRGPRHLRRPRLLAAARGRRVRARHARHEVLRRAARRSTTRPRRPASGSTSRSRSRTRSRCAARTAATSWAPTATGRTSRPAPADDRVDARARPARLRLPEARRARRPARRPRLRRDSCARARASLATIVRREWTGRGWYSRGYDGDRQIGTGVIFGEPQPWAILAGAPAPGRPGRSSPTSGAS